MRKQCKFNIKLTALTIKRKKKFSNKKCNMQKTNTLQEIIEFAKFNLVIAIINIKC